MLKRLFIVLGIALISIFIPYLSGIYVLPLFFSFNISNDGILVVWFLGGMVLLMLLIVTLCLIQLLTIVFNYIKHDEL